MAVGKLPPQQPQQQVGGLSKNQQLGLFLSSLSDVFAGKDPTSGLLQRQQFLQQQQLQQQQQKINQDLNALIDQSDLPETQKGFLKAMNPKDKYTALFPSGAKQPTSYQEYLLTDPTPTSAEYKEFVKPKIGSSAPTSYQEYVLTDTTPTPEEYANFLDKGSNVGSVLQVVDETGTFVQNISKSDSLGRLDEFAKKGYKLTQLPSGTEAAPSKFEKLDEKFEPIKSRYETGTNLIKELNVLADNLYKNPEAANKLVAGGANAIEFLKSNLQGFASVAENNKDNPIYQQVQKTAMSLEKTDWSDEIARVSEISQITDSQILDLAFTFAAARGQSGRGLSDRDFQNALDIISKGVNAEQKIAVMGDVARRISSEYDTAIDIAKRISPDDQPYLNRINNLGSLPIFINPYTQRTTPSPSKDDGIRRIRKKI